MKSSKFTVLINLLGVFFAAATIINAGSAVKRVSIAADGTQSNGINCNGGLCNGRTEFQSISADGRYAAFASSATNLVANDTNGVVDVFVKDRQTGAIVRVSTDSSGTQANNANTSGFTGSHHPSISADGRFVAFESYASNLVVGDTNSQLDVFVKDLQTGATVRLTFGGVQGNLNSLAPVISGNGRYVAFVSASSNLYPNNGFPFRVYRYDLQTGAISTVAGIPVPAPSNIDFFVNSEANLAISADGRYVVFGGQTPGATWIQVYRRDLSNNSVAAVSVNNVGTEGNNHSSQGNTLAEHQNIDITPDGRFVVFNSYANNLDPNDPNIDRDIYLRDLNTNTTTVISRTGGNPATRVTYNVSISADARFVAFDYSAGGSDVKAYVLDRSFNLLRNAPYTTTAGGGLFHPVIADNGRFLSFFSNRNDLVPNDTTAGGFSDVFVVDLLAAPSHRNQADFDGEAFADLAVFRPSGGFWYWLRSYDASFGAVQWGQNGDVPVAGDFDGDAKTDLAVFRPANGFWYLLRSTTNTFSFQQFGQNGDKPVPGDYDGDEKTDIAVFRPSDGVWYIALSGGNFRFQQWGAGTDKPTVGDFDGDGRSDLAVYRPSNGVWYLQENPLGGAGRAIAFGASGDRPVAADYNGDGITDIAVYRPSTGIWYFNNSRRNLPNHPRPLEYDFSATQWGAAEDLPAPADFDGDGRADVSVFRPSTGVWYQSRSNGGAAQIQQFGTTGDVPIGFANESN